MYADELIFINLIVNYFLILATAFVSGTEFRRKRVLFGSAVGGLSSLIIFIPPVHIALSVLIKLILSSLITMCSFENKSFRQFLKRYTAFFLVNFIFAGIMLAVWLTFRPEGMVYNNGVLYFDINATLLVLLSVVCYAVVTLISKLLRRRTIETHFGKAEITLDNKKIKADALLDTGNGLQDAFTGKPVIIAQYCFVSQMLPPELNAFFERGSLSECEVPDGWSGRIRLIPFNTVGCKGLLPSFRCDVIKAVCGKNTAVGSDVFVGVTKQKIFNGEYGVILNGNFFSFFENCKGGGSCDEAEGNNQDSDNKAEDKAVIGRRLLHKRAADAAAAAEQGGGSGDYRKAGARR